MAIFFPRLQLRRRLSRLPPPLFQRQPARHGTGFGEVSSARRGVAPYQMPSFSIQMLLSTYLKHTKTRETEDGRKWAALLEEVIRQNSMWNDRYFDEPGALHVAAGTSICGIKQKTSDSTMIPNEINHYWKENPELQKKFPDLVDLTNVDNTLVWAQEQGRKEHADINAYFGTRKPYHKRGPNHPWDRSYIKNTPLELPQFGAHPFAKPPGTQVNSNISSRSSRLLKKIRRTFSGKPNK